MVRTFPLSGTRHEKNRFACSDRRTTASGIAQRRQTNRPRDLSVRNVTLNGEPLRVRRSFSRGPPQTRRGWAKPAPWQLLVTCFVHDGRARRLSGFDLQYPKAEQPAPKPRGGSYVQRRQSGGGSPGDLLRRNTPGRRPPDEGHRHNGDNKFNFDCRRAAMRDVKQAQRQVSSRTEFVVVRTDGILSCVRSAG